MADELRADSVGPIDVAVIVFDGNTFSGQIAPALTDMQAGGLVRLVDLAFVTKDEHGTTQIAEITDADVAAVYSKITDPRFDLAGKSDLAELARTLPPRSSALVVVWENTWAARLATAVRESRGRVAAFERIPFEVVQRALAAVDAEEDGARPENKDLDSVHPVALRYALTGRAGDDWRINPVYWIDCRPAVPQFPPC
jgi:uncharacterized membrane protein